MGKYVKETSRINIKFIDAETEEQLFEIPNRNWTNMSEFFSDGIITTLMNDELKNKKMPKKILVIAVAELNLVK